MNKTFQPVGRPREFDETDVVKKVMVLFWSNGYEGTGLADIIASTGLAKGSLYKAFGSKHNLYLQSLALYEKLYVDSASEALLDSREPEERINEFLSLPLKNSNQLGESSGCFLCNASADQADLDKEIRALVQRGFDKLSKALQKAIKELQPDAKPEQVLKQSEALLAIYSGLRIMARSGADPIRMEAAKEGGLLSVGMKGFN